MKIAITVEEPSLDGKVEPRFGRCPYFLIIDPDTLAFESIENASAALGGGAGVQSAQVVAEKGATTLLTGNCGPNAHRTLSAAGIQVIVGCSGPIKDVIEQFKAGKLTAVDEPNVAGGFGTMGR